MKGNTPLKIEEPINQIFRGLYLLEGVPVTVCAVATVAWEGSPGVAVFG
jgi:hypothetical protein